LGGLVVGSVVYFLAREAKEHAPPSLLAPSPPLAPDNSLSNRVLITGDDLFEQYFYQFCWRFEMLKLRSRLNFVMLFFTLIGLIFVIGCGGSAEKQEMSKLLELYSNAVREYEAADEIQRAQLKEKIESYRHKYSTMIGELELNNKLTRQVIDELETEYKEITEKYALLNS
jgi:hypothetical protein